MALSSIPATGTPVGIHWLVALRAMRRDPLAFLTQVARTYGDAAKVSFGLRTLLVLSHPAYVEQVLVTDHRHFQKGRGLRMTSRVLGQGLLTSEGSLWRSQRRLVQPAFHKRRVDQYGETMVTYTQQRMASWKDGETRDMSREMMRLTLAITAKALFNADMESQADQVREDLTTLMRQLNQRMRALIRIPPSWPLPSNRRFERAARHLDALIYAIIDERRQTGEDPGDLLSMLLSAVDEDGQPMPARLVRDEVMTLFLAGHETTANAMTWTWYLLSQNPAVVMQLESELDRVLKGQCPKIEDLARLPYTQAVITESLRLFPPAWILVRQAIHPWELDGKTWPTGTQVLMSPWVIHHDPRFYPDADRFWPERWLKGGQEHRPPFAYFPFGGGPRLCIGRPFALMEAALLLATIAQRFRLALVAGYPVATEPLITLRPKHGLKMILTARKGPNR